MGKQAISVTLQSENLTWLKARAGSGEARSVSELLDRLISEARVRGGAGLVRSVVGTIDVDQSDPLLDKADDAIRALIAGSLARPLVVKEQRARDGRKRRRG